MCSLAVRRWLGCCGRRNTDFIKNIIRMSKLSRSPSIKFMPPKLKMPVAAFPRKERAGSQRTIDTNNNDRQSQIETLLRVNEEELMREVKESLERIQGCKGSLLRQKEVGSVREELKQKELTILSKQREIAQLNEEIGRLKEVYNRPKPKKSINGYSQQHLKIFTLAQQMAKQRKHLQLHIQHHQKLKQRAKEMHNSIKAILPQYHDVQKRRGLRPISYGDFRRKVIMQNKEKQIKMRVNSSFSSRSLSSRSRASSVKEIITGRNSVISSNEKDLYHIQKKRSIISKARSSTQRKHFDEFRELAEKIEFLRGEDATLSTKIAQLTKQAQLLQSTLSKSVDLTLLSHNRQYSKFSKITE